MIRVLFFASLRERLATGQLELAAQDTTSVADIRRNLQARGEDWGELLGDEAVMVAVNQSIARDHTSVCDGDEVAFFPPVTGG